MGSTSCYYRMRWNPVYQLWANCGQYVRYYKMGWNPVCQQGALNTQRKGKGEGGQLMFWLSQFLSLLDITLCQINLVLLKEALLKG